MYENYSLVGASQNKSSEKFGKTHRETPVPESLF